jgi:hypothetical protein
MHINKLATNKLHLCINRKPLLYVYAIIYSCSQAKPIYANTHTGLAQRLHPTKPCDKSVRICLVVEVNIGAPWGWLYIIAKICRSDSLLMDKCNLLVITLLFCTYFHFLASYGVILMLRWWDPRRAARRAVVSRDKPRWKGRLNNKFTSFKPTVSCCGKIITDNINILITLGTSQKRVYVLFNSVCSIR